MGSRRHEPVSHPREYVLGIKGLFFVFVFGGGSRGGGAPNTLVSYMLGPFIMGPLIPVSC